MGAADTITASFEKMALPELMVQNADDLDPTKLTALSPEVISRQATINVGTIGHVAHGKSTVVKAISGVQTVRFKNELERNITIKLGYANAKIYKGEKNKKPSAASVSATAASTDADAAVVEGGDESKEVSAAELAAASSFASGEGTGQRGGFYTSRGSSHPDVFTDPLTDVTYRVVRHVSFVDCPGHDILMATMLNGAAVMDAPSSW